MKTIPSRWNMNFTSSSSSSSSPPSEAKSRTWSIPLLREEWINARVWEGGQLGVRFVVTSCNRLVAHLVYLVRLYGCLLGAVILQLELTALVEGTPQIGFPFGWVRIVHPLLVLPCLKSPGLQVVEKVGEKYLLWNLGVQGFVSNPGISAILPDLYTHKKPTAGLCYVILFFSSLKFKTQ